MRKVLVVDDNALSIKGICKNIDWESMNSQVTATSSNGKEVIDIIQNSEIDLIISDIMMPGMTGLEMSKIILALKPNIKIILISAYDEFSYAKEAIRLGAFDYVEKPIDYAYLTDCIKKAIAQIDQEDRLLDELKNNHKELTQKFFYELINCNPEEAEFKLSSNAEYLNINVSCANYLCSIIHIQNTKELQSKFGMLHYQIQVMNLSEEIKKSFNIYDMVYCFIISDKIVVILGSTIDSDDVMFREVNDVYSDICEIHKNSPLCFTVGIGSIIKSFWDLPASYITANNAMAYRFFFSERQIFNIRDIKSDSSSVIFTDSAEDKLVNLLCQRNKSAIKEFTEELALNLNRSGLDRIGAFAYMYALLAKLMKFFHDTNISAPRVEDEISNVFSKLSKFETTVEICNWLYKLCILSCEALENSVETTHKSICENAIGYIKENYSDPELSLNNIAAHVSMSPTYLSEIFKKVTGQNISDTITDLRIDAAQTLLKTTNLSLKEISEKVGYSNQYYFSTSFKKRTGVPPSSFRSS